MISIKLLPSLPIQVLSMTLSVTAAGRRHE
jgi:hypothetical protein